MLTGERAAIDRLTASYPEIHWDRLLFSAKESVYKVWYPLTERWLNFEEARLSFDPAESAFRAEVLIDGDRIDGGAPLTELWGHFGVGRGSDDRCVHRSDTTAYDLGLGAAEPGSVCAVRRCLFEWR